MKKKITLLLTLIMSLVAIFAFSAMGVSAETSGQEGWQVKVNETVTVTQGTAATVDYELTYDDFTICYDDDNYCYEIFTEDKMFTIRESELKVIYDTETYIVIFDNNYKWQYNKAILVIGVKVNEE